VADTAVPDALMVAPAGVATLGLLEAQQRDERRPPWEAVPDTEPSAVEAAAASVQSMSFGELLAICLEAARSVGPWSPDASENLARLYPHTDQRRPIADAIAQRFGRDLEAPLDLEAQQWWNCRDRPDLDHGPRPGLGFEHVYANGEFTWAAERTVTDPPPEIHDALTFAWDHGGCAVRWWVGIRYDARVYRIDRPGDWVALVERFPKVATKEHDGWELPGVNSRRYPDVVGVEAASGGQARRATIDRHVLPDWRQVADHYDGVHLSWAGFLTTDGYISDLPSGGVTMLRYWHSERTFWLTNVFGKRTRLPDPEFD
jgi:hypothetical protein